MNPAKGKGERYIYCQHDGGECLNTAIKNGWRAYNCESCEVYLKSPEFEQKQIKNKKLKNKEQEEMAGQTTVINNDKNQLIDLNEALFKQMNRLTDESLSDEALQKEIQRSKAVSNLASQIVQNAKLALEGAKAIKSGEVDSGTLMLGRGK
jgi:hypothetical protein